MIPNFKLSSHIYISKYSVVPRKSIEEEKSWKGQTEVAIERGTGINMIYKLRSFSRFVRAENMKGPLDADKRAADIVIKRVLLL